MATEARSRIHRGASRGANLIGRSRRSEPLSFCARLHAILRRASASLPYGPQDGSRQELVADAGALGDTDRYPDWLLRNEFLHEGISQVHGTYAVRISTPPRGLASQVRSNRQGKPTGVENAQQYPISSQWRSEAVRNLRRKVWSHSVLLLANFPLFKEVRRSLQVARGGRPQMVAPFSSCATDSCRRNHRVSTQGGRAMSFLCKGGTT